MSEELLKAIIQLFAIVAKERVTEDEQTNIQEFLSLHLNRDAIPYYLQLFDEYSREKVKEEEVDIQNTDKETLVFIDEWSKIIAISKRINEGLSQQQKAVLLVKMIELLWANKEMSERQGNLIFYIGKAIKFEKKHVDAIKAFVMSQDIEDISFKEILIVDEGSAEHLYESLHLVRRNLTGFVAVLRLPGIETYFIKYIGITPMVLNGMSLKSRKIAILPTGSTIRGDKIETVYFSDIVGKFLYSEVESKTSFLTENLTFKFKNGDLGLRDINIAEDGGKLIGIMGASGSGKSTLLNVLNGNDGPSSGRVLINGIDVHREPRRIEGVIGYVPQDDFLIEELTVFQNLYFAARLTFSNLDASGTWDLVNKTLRSLGLMDTKDMIVGSLLEKVISGGQRKRLNIGLELLREPTILYVDEPTSGLSSRDSENIMDLLKELSLRGKMVFVVIHQPSSDIYKMFDTLLVLDVGGYPIYYGNPVDAVVYFKERVNMADRGLGACIECGTVRVEQIFNIIETAS